MPYDPITRIRRFNRAVTSETGALEDSFLGRGRPLGVARVLNGIGHGYQDISALREYLNLDSGLLSRILRGLEGEGLITVSTDPDDARKRRAELTRKGQAEHEAYESLSNDRATAMLARHPKPTALLEAMDLVASMLGRDRIEILPADPDGPDATYCVSEYYDEIGARFAKVRPQGFDKSGAMQVSTDDVRPPRGDFLIAYSDGLPIGCVALVGGADYGQIKRLWVAPAARGLGLARRLMQAAEARARELGIAVLRLDTNSTLPEAIALYRNDGWSEIDRYHDDPNPDHFFEKRLA